MNHGGCSRQDATLAVFEDLLRDEFASRVSGEPEHRRRREIVVRVFGLLHDLDAPGQNCCPQGTILIFGKIIDRIRKIYLIYDLQGVVCRWSKHRDPALRGLRHVYQSVHMAPDQTVWVAVAFRDNPTWAGGLVWAECDVSCEENRREGIFLGYHENQDQRSAFQGLRQLGTTPTVQRTTLRRNLPNLSYSGHGRW